MNFQAEVADHQQDIARIRKRLIVLSWQVDAQEWPFAETAIDEATDLLDEAIEALANADLDHTEEK
jgi:hypothetical protein